ncbi:MAG: porin family protein [Flavobacteriales bacterium]|jgi:hypothetical protein|tara:strand:- start:8279 stop:8959 length:681 start_codon:yes stop_codon:yes gene_type:complete
MHKVIIVFYTLFISLNSFSQNKDVDDNYREDQIYFGFYYNSLLNSPHNFTQNKFSSSLNMGFIRDVPLNSNRNFGIGIGLGMSTSSYNHNLKLTNESDGFKGMIIEDSNTFNKNKWTFNEIEVPFEVRWRTSTAKNYKFWRVYFGIKTSYIFSSKFKYDSSSEAYSQSSLPFNKIQSGFTLNAGNNTWNLGLYMGLQPLFNDQFTKKNSNFKNLKQFKLGLIFYIL